MLMPHWQIFTVTSIDTRRTRYAVISVRFPYIKIFLVLLAFMGPLYSL